MISAHWLLLPSTLVKNMSVTVCVSLRKKNWPGGWPANNCSLGSDYWVGGITGVSHLATNNVVFFFFKIMLVSCWNPVVLRWCHFIQAQIGADERTISADDNGPSHCCFHWLLWFDEIAVLTQLECGIVDNCFDNNLPKNTTIYNCPCLFFHVFFFLTINWDMVMTLAARSSVYISPSNI